MKESTPDFRVLPFKQQHAGHVETVSTSPAPDLTHADFDIARHLERVRADLIVRALARTRGHQARAAALLGLSPRMLNYLLSTRSLTPLIALAQIGTADETTALQQMRAYVSGRVGKDGWL